MGITKFSIFLVINTQKDAKRHTVASSDWNLTKKGASVYYDKEWARQAQRDCGRIEGKGSHAPLALGTSYNTPQLNNHRHTLHNRLILIMKS